MSWKTNRPHVGFSCGVIAFDQRVMEGPDAAETWQTAGKMMFPPVSEDTEERIENRLRFAWPGLHRRVAHDFSSGVRSVKLSFGGEPGVDLTVVDGRLATIGETHGRATVGGYAPNVNSGVLRTTDVGVGSSLYRLRKRVRLCGVALSVKSRRAINIGTDTFMLDTELLDAYVAAAAAGKVKPGMRTFDVFECQLSGAFDHMIPQKENNRITDGAYQEERAEAMIIPLYDKLYCRYGFVTRTADEEPELVQLGYAPHVVVAPAGNSYRMVLRCGSSELVMGKNSEPEILLGYTTNKDRAPSRVATCITKALLHVSHKGMSDEQAQKIREVLRRKYYKVVSRPMYLQEMRMAASLMARRELEEQRWHVQRMYEQIFENFLTNDLYEGTRRIVMRGNPIPTSAYSDPKGYGVRAYVLIRREFNAFVGRTGDDAQRATCCPLHEFKTALVDQVMRADSLKALALVERRVVSLLQKLAETIDSLKGERNA